MKRRISAFVTWATGLCGLGLVLAPDRATAEPVACNAWDVDYALTASLQLKETPMGQGDGVYQVGPGTITLRFEDRGGQPGGAAKIRAYGMREHVEVVAKAVFLTATVTSDTRTAAAPDKCGAAEGTLADRTLTWTRPTSGYRTDGTLTCDGSLCGKFGAPPSGTNPLQIGPDSVQFRSFAYGADMKTFTMPFTFVSKTDMPKQTGFLALAGRETKRACVQAKPCS
jgi:hypothetical protein